VFTKYPTIVDLQGKTTVNQTDVEAVQGYTEYMGATVADRVLVGVQRKSTLPSLYNISSDKQAAAIQVSQLLRRKSSHPALASQLLVEAVYLLIASFIVSFSVSSCFEATMCLLLCCHCCLQPGDDVTLTWQFVGVPRVTNCYHDGVLVLADCHSPMTITAAGFNDTSAHVFSAVLTDVCGNTKNAMFTYTATGVTDMTKADYVAQTITVDAGSPVTTKKNAAAMSGPGGLGALLVIGVVALMGVVVL
jgi:hypothetical protein